VPAWTIPWPNNGPPPSPYSYDAYASGDEGGTALDYWWKMSANYSGVGDSETNRGVAGTMPLYLRVSATSFTDQQATLVQNTEDALCVSKAAANNGHTAGILVDGTQAFTIGGWFNITGTAGSTSIFKTNAGNNDGYGCGLHIRPSSTNIGIIARRGAAGGDKLYNTASSTFSYNAIYFVALYVSPAPNTSGMTLKLYINGTEKTLTPSGSDHDINWNTSSGPEEKGVSFSRGDGQSNGSDYGKYDELFFHWGELSAATLAEMYARGS